MSELDEWLERYGLNEEFRKNFEELLAKSNNERVNGANDEEQDE